MKVRRLDCGSAAAAAAESTEREDSRPQRDALRLCLPSYHLHSHDDVSVNNQQGAIERRASKINEVN